MTTQSGAAAREQPQQAVVDALEPLGEAARAAGA